MPSAEKPGILGCLILVLGVAGVALMAAGLATPHWIFIPGSASVHIAEKKLLAGTNLTSAQLTAGWATYQAGYDYMVTMNIQLMTQRLALVNAQAMLIAMQGGTQAPVVPTTDSMGGTDAPQVDPIAGMTAQLAILDGALAEMGMQMGQVMALNASRKAMAPMGELNQWGGFFSMCVVEMSAETTCGGWSVYKSAFWEEVCEDDYVDPNPTVPSVDSILNKTRNCNADGLARAVKGSVGFFGGVLIAATAISLVPIILVLVMVVKPAPRGMPFNGILICILFALAGVLALAFTILYNFQIVGNYLANDMVGTKAGISWILSIVGGALYLVAGLAALPLGKGGNVAPEKA